MEQPSPSGSFEGDSSQVSASFGSAGLTQGAATPPYSNSEDRKRFAKVRKKNTRGETPLHVAARKGDDNLCTQLLRDGAEVNTADYAGWTALHEATSYGKFETASLLLSSGANVNQCSIEERTTPLHDAAHSANIRIVWLLLKSGADRDARNSSGLRPIDLCEKGSKAYELLSSSALPDVCPPETSPPPPMQNREKSTFNTEQGHIIGEAHSNDLSPSASSASIPNSAHIESSQMSEGQPSIANVTMTDCEETQAAVKGLTDDQNRNQDQSPPGVLSVDSQQTEAAMEESLLDVSHEAPTDPMRIEDEDKLLGIDADGEVDETALLVGAEEELELEEDDKKEQVPSPLTRRSAVWKQDRGTPRTDSPDAYDFYDEDRCRSEDRDSTRRGRGRGGARASARATRNTSTPLANTPLRDSAEKKRGRGRKRGRHAGSHSGRGGSSASSPHLKTEDRDDVYEFRSSPESEINTAEVTSAHENPAPPSSKRIRLTGNDDAPGIEEERVGSSAGNSNGDAEMEELPEEDEDSKQEELKDKSRAKVPILRISLKTPSEDDPLDDSHSVAGSLAPSTVRGKGSSRGGRPSIKRPRETAEVDDTSRMTRSRVRQSGRTVEEPDIWTKKRGRRAAQVPTATPDHAASPETDNKGSSGDRPSTSREYNLEDIVAAEPNLGIKIMLYNSHKGYLSLRKQIEARWTEDVKSDQALPQSLPEKHDKYLTMTRNYSLNGDIEDDKPITEEPPSILPLKVHPLWRNQETERERLRCEQASENARTRMMIEREFVRLERREKGETHKMTTVRMIKESEIYNSLFLLETQPAPKPMERSAFTNKMNDMIENIYREQKIKAACLRGRQKSKLEWESRVAGTILDESTLNHIVTLVIAKKIQYSL